MSQHFQLRLQSSHLIAPTVRHFVFERVPDDTDANGGLAYIPGQFIQVHFHYDDGKATKRSYSIANVSADAELGVREVEIAVSYVDGGAATKLFQNLQIGDCIQASGPYGRFCLQANDQNQRYLLVATGTGVTPYRAMLPKLANLMRERDVRVDLVFGARSEAELLYASEFDDFAKSHANFRFHPCFSRTPRAHANAHDRRGYVQDALADLQLSPESDIAYLCGNPNMVDASFELLKNTGLPTANIRREKYVSSK